ncbi:MAG: translocation/assembly module TamB domain-containing protein [Planctomycetota bacterium]|jgi:hypothetical protein
MPPNKPRWPRLRRLLKWCGRIALLVLLALVAVYLLRDRLLARPLARLVANRMSKELGGRFTLERVEGDYFREFVLIGLHTEDEPERGPIRRLDIDRASVQIRLGTLLRGDVYGSVRAVAIAGLALDADLDRKADATAKRREETIEETIFPKSWPELDINGSIRIRAGGRIHTIRHLNVTGGGTALALACTDIDLGGEVGAPRFRLQVVQPTAGTLVIQSEDELGGIVPRDIRFTTGKGWIGTAELDVAEGSIAAELSEQQAKFAIDDVNLANMPDVLLRRLPAGTQWPEGGVLSAGAQVDNPFEGNWDARGSLKLMGVRWTDWSVEEFHVKGSWNAQLARFRSMDAVFEKGFVRVREVEVRPKRKVPLVQIGLVEAELPDLRVPMRRLGGDALAELLPDDPVALNVSAHRNPGEPIRIDAMSIRSGPSQLRAFGELSLPAEVDGWRTAPIELFVTGDFDASSLPKAAREADVTGSISVKGKVRGTPMSPVGDIEITSRDLSIDGRAIEALEAKGDVAWPIVDLEFLRFRANEGRIELSCRADLEKKFVERGSYEIDVPDLAKLAALVPKAPPMSGAIRGSGKISRASLDGDREGDVELVCENLLIDGKVIDAARIEATLLGDRLTVPELSARGPEWSVTGAGDATVHFEERRVDGQFQTLSATVRKKRFFLREPLGIAWGGATLAIRGLDADVLGGRIHGGGRIGDTIDLKLNAEEIDFATLHEEASGRLGIDLTASGSGDAPEWSLKAKSTGLRFLEHAGDIDISAFQDATGIRIPSLRLTGLPGVSVLGSGHLPLLALRDGIRVLDGKPDLKLAVSVARSAVANFVPEELQFATAALDAKMIGNALEGTFRVRKLGWAGMPADFLAREVLVRLTGDGNSVGAVLDGANAGALSASARVRSEAGIDWRDPKAMVRRLLSSPAAGKVSLQIPDLAPLQSLTDSPIVRARGSGQVDVELGGTPKRPELNGTITIKASRIRLTGDTPGLQDVEAQIAFDGTTARIRKFEARLGYAPLRVEGSVALATKPTESHLVDLRVKGENLLLLRSPYLRLRSDLDVAIKGPFEKLAVTGDANITNALYSEPVKLLSSGGATAADDKLHLFSIREGPLANMEFDVGVRALETIRVDNNIVRGALSSDLRLRGTGAVPHLTGRVDFREMDFRFPVTRERLTLERGSLVFPHDDPFHPVVRVAGEARKLGHDLNVEIRGKVPDVEVHINSVPALPRDEALLLLTAGTTKDRLQESGQTTAGMYAGRSILDAVLGPSDPDKESMMDRFEFESGREVSEAGDPSIEARFRMTRLLYIVGERDRWEEYNGGVMLRLRFR